MKDIKADVMRELFDSICVEINRISCTLSEDDSIRLSGAVKAEECLGDYVLFVKANLCDEAGNVLYVISTFEGIDFEFTRFDAFSTFCTQLSRFMDVSKLHHVEIYPKVKRE